MGPLPTILSVQSLSPWSSSRSVFLSFAPSQPGLKGCVVAEKVSRSWPHPQKGGGGVDFSGPALPPLVSLALGRLCQWSPIFFFFFSWLKYFAKDQVIGEWSEEGMGVTPSPPKQVV